MLRPPAVGPHLLRDQDEVVVDVVRRHWFAYARPAAEAVLLLPLLALVGVVPSGVAWVPLLLAGALAVRVAVLALAHHHDLFVVTNQRVFRMHGVLSRRRGNLPLTKVVDLTVVKPLHGRVLGFGHFVFESAAQVQGLHEIRYVPRIDVREKRIQEMITRAGLRGPGLRQH
ncbi:MAG: membrane-flanked domain protein [Nocardioides sp.]|nr:membrane-flanked domain protein [Nocardioides sp.]